ncbi:MAG: hypothetical protein U0796_20120 [Gemmatales bacterium]
MSARQLVLLSSQRPSSKYRHTIHQDDADAWLNGYLALWHPLILAESQGLPVIGTHEEFESPQTPTLFIVPRTAYQYQSPSWHDEHIAAGSLVVEANTSLEETWQHLALALGRSRDEFQLDSSLSFAGIGLGYILLEAYAEAQDHVNPLDKDGFYAAVKEAATTHSEEDRSRLLGQAAHLLQGAREVMQPSQLYQAISLSPSGPPEQSMLADWLNEWHSITLISSGEWISRWIESHPAVAEQLQSRIKEAAIDWWVANQHEQPDAMLPFSNWLENVHAGLKLAQKLSSRMPENAGRRSYAAGPTLPTLLHSYGVKRSLHFSADSAVWPYASNSLIAWRGPDSELLESCTRKPEPLEQSETAFHLAHLLHEAGTAEYVGWIHLGILRGPLVKPYWFRCWAALHQLAPVFGHLGSLDQTVRDIPATEQFTPVSADDFQSDYLLELTGHADESAQHDAISRFKTVAETSRLRESIRTLQALHAVITPTDSTTESSDLSLEQLLAQWRQRLSPQDGKQSGYLLLNPCSFTRQVHVHLPEASTLMPAPATASQKAEAGIDAIVELPPLGFAWLPHQVEKGAKVRMPKAVIAKENILQNGHLIVEVDPSNGGLRSVRDTVREVPRLGQQLVFAPGSTMHATSTRIVRNGHALGEIESTGELRDAHGNALANFRQSFVLGAAQKYVEVKIKLEPKQLVTGYPWHAYFASRWAWRDPQARLSKSIHHTKMPVQQTRPETPGFIEIESAHGRVAIFSGGLPFWQRHSSRMLDSLLLVEGETSEEFHFALSVDDDLPHLTEQDWLTPAIATSCSGPPAAGATSWLFHLDAPSVMLMDMHLSTSVPRKVTMRLLETFGYATEALLQCPATPQAAYIVDSWGNQKQMISIRTGESAVALRLGCYEFLQLCLEF